MSAQEEKTEHLKQAAMTEAREKANRIVREHQDALEDLFAQHKAEAKQQKATRVEAETSAARQKLNMSVSKAELLQKQEWGRALNEINDQLFGEVRDLIQAYMQTDEYVELLVRYIQDAVDFAQGAQMTIYINPTDADRKEELEERTGQTLTVSKEDFIGGVRAVIREKNILIDHAFKGAIEEEYKNFLSEGGAYVG